MLYVKNISIYGNFRRGGGGGGGHTWFTLHFLFIIQKNYKKYKSMTYTKNKFYIILI